MDFCEKTDAGAIGHAVVDGLEDTVEIVAGFYETKGLTDAKQGVLRLGLESTGHRA